MAEYDNDGIPIQGLAEFTDGDYLLGSDEGDKPATFSKKVLSDALYKDSVGRRKKLTHIGNLKDGDLLFGLRDDEPVIYTYDAIIGAKPKGLVFSDNTVTDTGGGVKVVFRVVDREGFDFKYRLKYVGGEFNEWSANRKSGAFLSYPLYPVPLGPQTIEVQAKTAFTTQNVVWRANVDVTASNNEDVSVDLTATGGEDIANVSATITDTSGDEVYWRGKHDLGKYTDWQGPFTSPHQLTWKPSVPGGVRVITVQGKSFDNPPFAEKSSTVTVTEAPLLPGQFKLIDPQATHDRNVEFMKTIRYNASADLTQLKLIARKHTGEWLYNGAWFMKKGENRISIPVTLPYNVGSTDVDTGTKFFWKVVMEGGSIEHEFEISTLAPPNIAPDMTGYGDPVKHYNFGTGGNITNAAQLSAEFDWGMYHGSDDPNHPKNNAAEWSLFTDFTSDNYSFGSDYLAIRPINTVDPAIPAKDDITSGSIRSKYTVEAESFKSYFIEANINLPAGKGFWPAFWMFPHGGGDKGHSEVDIFEFVGSIDERNDDGDFIDLHTNLHAHGDILPRTGNVQYGSTLSDMIPSPSTLSATYALEIDGPNKRLKYFYNGRMIRDTHYDFHATDGSGWAPAPSPNVIINLAVGGGWPGPADDVNAYSGGQQNMLIRYLKIFSKTG